MYLHHNPELANAAQYRYYRYRYGELVKYAPKHRSLSFASCHRSLYPAFFSAAALLIRVQHLSICLDFFPIVRKIPPFGPNSFEILLLLLLLCCCCQEIKMRGPSVGERNHKIGVRISEFLEN